MTQYRKYVTFEGKILIVGFGSVGQGTLPLILRHIDVPASRIKIITAEDWGREIANEYGVEFVVEPLTRENYAAILKRELKAGDFLFNASYDVESLSLIEYCCAHDILYLDLCIEPWAGVHSDSKVSAARRSNYAYRESALEIRKRFPNGPTAVVMHGANPGLVSHFLKQALLDINRDTGLNLPQPNSREQWAQLAMKLGIKVVQVAERDHQVASKRKQRDEFVNTWSSGAFVGESLQPAEMGWGTHERHWPRQGMEYGFGCGASIYLNRPGCTTHVRSWVPKEGPFQGWLISHGEAHTIPDYYSVRENGRVVYRPTCYYAYHPCDDAVLSMHEMVGHNFRMQPRTRLLRDEITGGFDELGVLLGGHAKNAYWYGSQLSIEEARKLCPYNNATSLQVNSGAMAAIVWAMLNPRAGVVEPDEMDFHTVLDIARPYLGPVVGVYSQWTPLESRGVLYPEDVDRDDPWQFKNFLVV